MDKKMLAAYVRIVVKEAIEEELDKILDKKLTEAINQYMEVLSEQTQIPKTTTKRPAPSRTELAQMLGLERLDSETLVASTKNMVTQLPAGVDASNKDVQKVMSVINRDYSNIMKKII